MNKTLEQLKRELKELNIKADILKKEIEERELYTLMYIKKGGKRTFVLQPKRQKDNLIQNGWKEINLKELTELLSLYDL